MKRVHVPNVSGHSLNKINQDIKKSLDQHFSFVDGSPADILVQHYVSGIGTSKKYNRKILIQPIDGTRINQGMVKSINQFDLILAPAEASKKIMESSGVIKPIRIISNYYDDDLLDIKSNFFDVRYSSKKYTFYSETTGIKRKNVDNLLRYFLDEFSGKPEAEKVRLVLKLSSGDKTKMSTLEKIRNSYQNAPEVDIYNQWLDDADLNSLRRGMDCYVMLSYMEGFCIPLLNAAVLKKDIICLNSTISGYMDFINKGNSILVPVKKIPIDQKHESLLIYDKTSTWEEPIYPEYQRALRKAYTGEYQFDKVDDFSDFSKRSVMEKYREEIEGRDSLGCCISQESSRDAYSAVCRDLERIGVDGCDFFEYSKIIRSHIKRSGIPRNSFVNNIIQTHIDVLKTRESSKLEYSLICDDDVIVIRDDEKILDIVRKAPEDWDIIFLGGMNHYHPPFIIDDDFYRCRFSFNPHCYLIKTSFIPVVLSELEKREAECDVIFAKMQESGIGNWYGLKRDMIIPSGRNGTKYISLFPPAYAQVKNLERKRTGDLRISRISSDSSIKGIKYVAVRGSSGYANCAKDYIIGISDSGIPVTPHLLKHNDSSYLTGDKNSRVNSLKDDGMDYDALIIHLLPDLWKNEVDTHGANVRDKIGYFAWEADKIPDEWSEGFDVVDKIAVPCEWNRKVLIDSGVTKPICVIPHIYDEIVPKSFGIPGYNGEFVFYTIGQFLERKGIEDSVRSYLGAFTSEDNVCLIVKTEGREYNKSDREIVRKEIEKIISEFPNPAKVITIVDEISDGNIAYLHSIGDCFISLFKAEGWGLSLFDATIKGTPVICTGYGGSLDFTCGPYVNYEIGPITDHYKWFNESQKWAYPDISRGSLIMRDVYENIDSYKKIAEDHSAIVKEKFSTKKIIEKFIGFIKEKP